MALGRGQETPVLWMAAVAPLLAVTAMLVRLITLRAGAMLFFLAAGYADFIITAPPTPDIEGRHTITADVLETQIHNRAMATMNVVEIDGKATEPYQIRAASENVGIFEAGSRIRFIADIRPHDVSDIPDVRSSREIPFCFVPDTARMAVIPTPGITGMMRRWRGCFLDWLYLSPLSPTAKEFVGAALLGEKSILNEETRQSFSKAGIAHILSLSGLHVAIVAGLFYWLLSPIVLIFPRHARTVILFAAVWAYSCLTGLGTPVVRAAIMTSAVLTGDLLQRRTVPLNSLCAAALVILLLDPRQLSEPGFQLTFAAVAGIVFFGKGLTPLSESKSRVMTICGETFGISIAAMLATGMIAAVHFHSFPLLFICANMVLVPIVVPAILTGGLIVISAVAVGMPCGVVAKVVNLLVQFTEWTAATVAKIPCATIDTWHISTLTAVLFMIFILMVGIALWLPVRPPRLARSIAVTMGIATTVSAALTSGVVPPEPAGSWHMAPVATSTNILVPAGRSLYLVTDAKETVRPHLIEHLEDILEVYMGRRGIDSIIIAPKEISVPGFIRCGNRLRIGNTSILIIGDGETAGYGHADVAVIAGGFRGPMTEIIDSVQPREAVLTQAIHPRLRRRFSEALEKSGIKVRQMAQRCDVRKTGQR